MLKLTDLTGGEVAGAGLFDELMRTAKSLLEQEYDAGRIVGADYPTVYLGAIQFNLQTAAQYLLAYEVQNQQVLLLQEQIQGADLDNQLKADTLITNALQRELLTAQVEAANKQVLKLVEETKLVTQQVAQSKAQEDQVRKQIEQLTAQISLTSKQEDLVDNQILTEGANTKLPTAGLTKATYDKTLSEIAILNQKLVTETAQTEGTIDTVGGLVGQEMSLKTNQGNSFLRDAEQKAAKFYADILSIAYSVDPLIDPALWGAGPTESNAVFTKLLEGIGVSDPTP